LKEQVIPLYGYMQNLKNINKQNLCILLSYVFHPAQKIFLNILSVEKD